MKTTRVLILKDKYGNKAFVDKKDHKMFVENREGKLVSKSGVKEFMKDNGAKVAFKIFNSPRIKSALKK